MIAAAAYLVLRALPGAIVLHEYHGEAHRRPVSNHQPLR